jgi:hypothetical protein
LHFWESYVETELDRRLFYGLIALLALLATAGP